MKKGIVVAGLVCVSVTGLVSGDEPAPKTSRETPLHSLASMRPPAAKDDAGTKTFARPDGKATDSVLRVLGDRPLEPLGEMLKAAPAAPGPIETVNVLRNGDVLFGENAGIQRQLADGAGGERVMRSDPSHCSPIDFWWDAQNRKLHVRSIEVTENGDAPEIGIRRSGDGTYPNGPPLPSAAGDNLGILFWMGWAHPDGFDDRAGQIYVRAAEDITSHGSGGNMYLATTPKGSSASPVDRVIVTSEGRVGVNVDPPMAQFHVMGLSASGVAEDYRAGEPLEPGDVVAIVPSSAPGGPLTVKRATRAYDPCIVGVVASDPAVRISQDRGGPRERHSVDPNDVPVIAAGRTIVKVSTENGPIRLGDYLTSSSKPGVAMKATEKGEALGKALQAHDGDQPGTIPMLAGITRFTP